MDKEDRFLAAMARAEAAGITKLREIWMQRA